MEQEIDINMLQEAVKQELVALPNRTALVVVRSVAEMTVANPGCVTSARSRDPNSRDCSTCRSSSVRVKVRGRCPGRRGPGRLPRVPLQNQNPSSYRDERHSFLAPIPQINAIDSQSSVGDGALVKWRFTRTEVQFSPVGISTGAAAAEPDRTAPVTRPGSTQASPATR